MIVDNFIVVGKKKVFSTNKENETAVFSIPNGNAKGVWWMPRLLMAMKDVAKLR